MDSRCRSAPLSSPPEPPPYVELHSAFAALKSGIEFRTHEPKLRVLQPETRNFLAKSGMQFAKRELPILLYQSLSGLPFLIYKNTMSSYPCPTPRNPIERRRRRGWVTQYRNECSVQAEDINRAFLIGVFRALSPSHAQGKGNPFLDHPHSAMKAGCESGNQTLQSCAE